VHPALSIIVFTVASGAGYGLLALLGALAALGRLPADRGFAAAALILALGLITLGLASSTFHLGQKARAWRALSQWRSSWLSREGVAALATYLAALPFAFGWLAAESGGLYLRPAPTVAWAAIATTVLSLVTVLCTAMIYASLKPVHQWRNRWVPPNYLALGLLTGALWLHALWGLFGLPQLVTLGIAVVAIAAAWPLKLAYWRFIDSTRGAASAESATGLGGLGAVRLLDLPHTEENYLQREMGFQIARKHAARLREITVAAAFGAPLALLLVTLLAELAVGLPGWAGALLGLVAALLASAGVLVERWLFFAEARHAVTLYYGATAT
jgi:DMSO reductase anchor subunit